MIPSSGPPPPPTLTLSPRCRSRERFRPQGVQQQKDRQPVLHQSEGVKQQVTVLAHLNKSLYHGVPLRPAPLPSSAPSSVLQRLHGWSLRPCPLIPARLLNPAAPAQMPSCRRARWSPPEGWPHWGTETGGGEGEGELGCRVCITRFDIQHCLCANEEVSWHRVLCHPPPCIR